MSFSSRQFLNLSLYHNERGSYNESSRLKMWILQLWPHSVGQTCRYVCLYVSWFNVSLEKISLIWRRHLCGEGLQNGLIYSAPTAFLWAGKDLYRATSVVIDKRPSDLIRRIVPIDSLVKMFLIRYTMILYCAFGHFGLIADRTPILIARWSGLALR